MSKHCDIGNHETEQDIYRCHHCNRAVCEKHVGNPLAQPGDLLACPDHVEEVRQAEARLTASRRRRQAEALQDMTTEDFKHALRGDLYVRIQTHAMANHALHEQLAHEVRHLLGKGTPQHLEDALYMTSVALGKVPLEILAETHEFLRTYMSIVEKSK